VASGCIIDGQSGGINNANPEFSVFVGTVGLRKEFAVAECVDSANVVQVQLCTFGCTICLDV
jgi:hypothetical protein